MEQDAELYKASGGDQITINRTQQGICASREVNPLGNDGRPNYADIKVASSGVFTLEVRGQKAVYKLTVDDDGEYKLENAQGSYYIRQVSRHALEPLMFV